MTAAAIPESGGRYRPPQAARMEWIKLRSLRLLTTWIPVGPSVRPAS